jgi:hypothetical protein
MNKEALPNLGTSRGILFDYYIDWHEAMCWAHSTTYKYTGAYPRLSYKETTALAPLARMGLTKLRKLCESYEDFADYYEENYTRYFE